MVQQLRLNLGKSEKLQSNLGKIENIYINWKHLGEVHQFITASFNCGQLQKESYSKLGYIE